MNTHATGMWMGCRSAVQLPFEPGDKTRSLGGMGTAFFPLFNRGKRSIVLDFDKADDRETMHRLLEGADAHNVGYKVNVAAFDPVNLPCLRLVAAGDQVPKFGLETSLTIDMPPVADFDFNNYSKSPTKRCYATPLAASMPQPKPAIARAIRARSTMRPPAGKSSSTK